jgi:hypothetical protein
MQPLGFHRSLTTALLGQTVQRVMRPPLGQTATLKPLSSAHRSPTLGQRLQADFLKRSALSDSSGVSFSEPAFESASGIPISETPDARFDINFDRDATLHESPQPQRDAQSIQQSSGALETLQPLGQRQPLSQASVLAAPASTRLLQRRLTAAPKGIKAQVAHQIQAQSQPQIAASGLPQPAVEPAESAKESLPTAAIVSPASTPAPANFDVVNRPPASVDSFQRSSDPTQSSQSAPEATNLSVDAATAPNAEAMRQPRSMQADNSDQQFIQSQTEQSSTSAEALKLAPETRSTQFNSSLTVQRSTHPESERAFSPLDTVPSSQAELVVQQSPPPEVNQAHDRSQPLLENQQSPITQSETASAPLSVESFILTQVEPIIQQSSAPETQQFQDRLIASQSSSPQSSQTQIQTETETTLAAIDCNQAPSTVEIAPTLDTQHSSTSLSESISISESTTEQVQRESERSSSLEPAIDAVTPLIPTSTSPQMSRQTSPQTAALPDTQTVSLAPDDSAAKPDSKLEAIVQPRQEPQFSQQPSLFDPQESASTPLQRQPQPSQLQQPQPQRNQIEASELSTSEETEKTVGSQKALPSDAAIAPSAVIHSDIVQPAVAQSIAAVPDLPPAQPLIQATTAAQPQIDRVPSAPVADADRQLPLSSPDSIVQRQVDQQPEQKQQDVQKQPEQAVASELSSMTTAPSVSAAPPVSGVPPVSLQPQAEARVEPIASQTANENSDHTEIQSIITENPDIQPKLTDEPPHAEFFGQSVTPSSVELPASSKLETSLEETDTDTSIDVHTSSKSIQHIDSESIESVQSSVQPSIQPRAEHAFATEQQQSNIKINVDQEQQSTASPQSIDIHSTQLLPRSTEPTQPSIQPLIQRRIEPTPAPDTQQQSDTKPNANQDQSATAAPRSIEAQSVQLRPQLIEPTQVQPQTTPVVEQTFAARQNTIAPSDSIAPFTSSPQDATLKDRSPVTPIAPRLDESGSALPEPLLPAVQRSELQAERSTHSTAAATPEPAVKFDTTALPLSTQRPNTEQSPVAEPIRETQKLVQPQTEPLLPPAEAQTHISLKRSETRSDIQPDSEIKVAESTPPATESAPLAEQRSAQPTSPAIEPAPGQPAVQRRAQPVAEPTAETPQTNAPAAASPLQRSHTAPVQPAQPTTTDSAQHRPDLPVLPKRQPLGLTKPLAQPDLLMPKLDRHGLDSTEPRKTTAAVPAPPGRSTQTESDEESVSDSPAAWSSLEQLLGQSAPPTAASWQQQFQLPSATADPRSASLSQAESAQPLSSRSPAAESQYTLTSPIAAAMQPGQVQPGQVQPGQVQPGQTGAIDASELELLAQTVYGLIRDRFAIDRERYLHTAAQQSPWIDIISPDFFKSIKLTSEADSPNAQQQPIGVNNPLPRQLEALTQAVYQLLQSRLAQEQERQKYSNFKY